MPSIREIIGEGNGLAVLENIGIFNDIARTLIDVWDAIAIDTVPDEGNLASRALVQEIVCDCDRLESVGSNTEAVATFRALPQSKRQIILDKVFPFMYYEVGG